MLFSRSRLWSQAPALGCALALIVGLATVGSATDSEVVSAARHIEALVNASDLGGLEEVRDQLLALHQKEPTSESRYALAYCRYRLATLQMETAKGSSVGEMLESAQADLEQAVKDSPEDSSEKAEAMSLLAGVMGFRISIEPGLGMSLGMRSGQLLSKAKRLSGDNPRVLLQTGISKLNTPRMFGGSSKKAEVALRKAVLIFAGEDPGEDGSAPWPDWGYLDALAWLGQALVAQDRNEEARAVYQQALALEPNMGWIRYQLLPALDEDGS